MSSGIAAWGTYLPYWRLQRSAIAGVLGSGGGPGDPRRGLLRRGHHHAGGRGRPAGPGRRPGHRSGAGPLLLHAGPGVPRQDERHHRARGLGLGRACGAYDLGGSARSALGTLLHGPRAAGGAGGGRTTLAVLSDLRTGLAGSAEERDSGDGGGGLRLRARRRRGRARRAAARRATSSSTAGGSPARRTRTCGRSASARSSTSRWPARPSRRRSRTPVWPRATSTTPIVTGLHARAVKAVTEGPRGARRSAWRPTSPGRWATSARPRPGSRWPTCSSGPEPGQVVAVLSLADGADALVLRTTDALAAAQQAPGRGGRADGGRAGGRRAATTCPTRRS